MVATRRPRFNNKNNKNNKNNALLCGLPSFISSIHFPPHFS